MGRDERASLARTLCVHSGGEGVNNGDMPRNAYVYLPILRFSLVVSVVSAMQGGTNRLRVIKVYVSMGALLGEWRRSRVSCFLWGLLFSRENLSYLGP